MKGLDYEGRILYGEDEDDKIMIGVNPLSGIDHDAFIRDDDNDFVYCYLGRGILGEFARAKSVNRIRSSLQAMQAYEIEPALKRQGLNLSDFAWACSKAVSKDQEDLIFYLSNKLNS